MPMQFDEFARELDSVIRATPKIERTSASGDQVVWSANARRAAVTLAPPLNVSVELGGGDSRAQTTWYPVDAALVPVVSDRILRFLGQN
jgi:hypothetical protein